MESNLYKNVKKIYGPYKGKDNRLRCIIKFKDNTQKTISYPKFLMQEHIKRFIIEPYTIDHIDSNPLNNEISNLRIIKRTKHTKTDVLRLKPQSFICGVCKVEFILKGKKLHDAYENRKKGKKGPFCGRSCAGKASHNINKYKTLKVTKKLITNKQEP
jgi:hypothetical protein